MVRPAVGTVSGELTSSSQAATIDATCRGLWIVGYGSSNTSFTHATATISIGGVSFTHHESRTQTQVHVCGYYAEDISARTNDTISISGWTLGTSVNQYRWRYYNITHATHKVTMAAEGGNNANANGGSIVFTCNPGASVQARALISINTQSTVVSGQTGLTSSTNHFSNTGSPAGTTHRKWGDSGAITGSTSIGYNIGAGSNTQRALVGIAFIEGAALTKPPRVFVMG